MAFMTQAQRDRIAANKRILNEKRRVEFQAASITFEIEFKEELAKDLIRLKRIGGKKKYYRDKDGKVKTRYVDAWATISKKTTYLKQAKMIKPTISQLADDEDRERTVSDMYEQIDHFEYRYEKGLEVLSGKPLDGEALKLWKQSEFDRSANVQRERSDRSKSVWHDPENLAIMNQVFEIWGLPLKDVSASDMKLDVEMSK